MGLALTMVWSWIARQASFKQLIAPGLAGEALSTGLEFYRGELKRHQTYFRKPWVWFLGPVLAAIGFFLLPILRNIVGNPALLRNITPFGVILCGWIILFIVRARRDYVTVQK